MLADSCDVYFTVLMQDRRGRIICVKCESDSMANAGQEDRMTPVSKMSNGGSNANTEGRGTGNVTSTNAISIHAVPTCETLTDVEETLTAEMKNSALALQRISQLQGQWQNSQAQLAQEKLLLVKYIRECAETLQSLKVLK